MCRNLAQFGCLRVTKLATHFAVVPRVGREYGTGLAQLRAVPEADNMRLPQLSGLSKGRPLRTSLVNVYSADVYSFDDLHDASGKECALKSSIVVVSPILVRDIGRFINAPSR